MFLTRDTGLRDTGQIPIVSGLAVSRLLCKLYLLIYLNRKASSFYILIVLFQICQDLLQHKLDIRRDTHVGDIIIYSHKEGNEKAYHENPEDGNGYDFF